MGMNELTIDIPAEYQMHVFGQFDSFAKKIERTLHVTLIPRGDTVKILGEEGQAQKARSVLAQLTELARRGNEIREQNVDYTLSLVHGGSGRIRCWRLTEDMICHTTPGQAHQAQDSGTEKICGCHPAEDDRLRHRARRERERLIWPWPWPLQAFKNGEVGRIILTRPAIEAGEKLGFLPGDLQSKIDPYLRPLYDALYQIMGAESFLHNSEKGLIEVAPLAYMRGRTLDNAFIILDEAQNTTPAQMKMFLTRIGFGSKVVDHRGCRPRRTCRPAQVSGLDVAVKVVKNIDDISICHLTSRDVVRHPLVQRIVKAYEEYEAKAESKKSRGRDRRRK